MRIPRVRKEQRLLVERFIKWGITGTLTVALDVLLFRSLYPMTHSVLLANSIGMPLSTSFNYLIHHHWSFQASRGHGAATPRFLVALLFGYLLNSTIVKIALESGATPAFAKLAAVPLQAPINFIILYRWVFHDAVRRKYQTLPDTP